MLEVMVILGGIVLPIVSLYTDSSRVNAGADVMMLLISPYVLYELLSARFNWPIRKK